MKKFSILICLALMLVPTGIKGQLVSAPSFEQHTVASPTEGVIDNTFVGEEEMMNDLLKMLAKFGTYLVNDYQACVYPNDLGEECGCFKGESTMRNNEPGVRTNADLSMICAFLVKYAQPKGIELPQGVSYSDLEDLARKTLVFAYSTHKANKLKVCAGNTYWGSVSNSDRVWESSLWAMSVAYSAYFQWDKLNEAQRGYIYNLLKAECNYELERTIPTGYKGDTKAEENGWESNILAATLGLFPNDELAPKWFERMREFAINSYSHISDADNHWVIDPEYNSTTVADLYKGANLYSDYTIQNHGYFHTSYQNVVMQELGESALALKLFQGENAKWKSNSLLHNSQNVMDHVLNWLALADGELAMPNGNDWSLFLFDQITSYSTLATFNRDPNALLLENLAYKQIKARQTTTADGSWLLRPDVQARRMGVEAHRVMMTYLMHLVTPTTNLKPTEWEAFRNAHSSAKWFKEQNVVRAYTPDRFTCFSWSKGLKSYTGYFSADCTDKNKILVPYRANNTGNILGWYELSGKRNNAFPLLEGRYTLDGDGYVMNGALLASEDLMTNRFVIYSTPQNAFIYLDNVTANGTCHITREKGGLLAISTDELTSLTRTLYYEDNGAIGSKTSDGTDFTRFNTEWINVDNQLGIIGKNGKRMAFGDRDANNSIFTSKLYPMYSDAHRKAEKGEQVDARHLVYYSKIDAATTRQYLEWLTPLRSLLPTGWNGVIAPDADRAWMIVSNLGSDTTQAHISQMQYRGMAPVVKGAVTTINKNASEFDLTIPTDSAFTQAVTMLIKGNGLTVEWQSETSALVKASKNGSFDIQMSVPGKAEGVLSKGIKIKKDITLRVYLNEQNEICSTPHTI